VLSSSFFKDSDSIHRKNSNAGEASQHDRGIQPQSIEPMPDAMAIEARVRSSQILPLPDAQQQQADQQDQDEEHHDDGGAVAQIIVGECGLIEQNVSRSRWTCRGPSKVMT